MHAIIISHKILDVSKVLTLFCFYQIGLKGEELKLFSMGGNSSRMQSNTSIWESYAGMKSAPAYQPLIWYKVVTII